MHLPRRQDDSKPSAGPPEVTDRHNRTQPYEIAKKDDSEQEDPPGQNAPPKLQVINESKRTGEILRTQPGDYMAGKDRPPKKHKSTYGLPESEQIEATKKAAAADPSNVGAVTEGLHEDSLETEGNQEDLHIKDTETSKSVETEPQDQARNELSFTAGRAQIVEKDENVEAVSATRLPLP